MEVHIYMLLDLYMGSSIFYFSSLYKYRLKEMKKWTTDAVPMWVYDNMQYTVSHLKWINAKLKIHLNTA